MYNGVKVFSATKAADRLSLGEKITAWIREHIDAVDLVDRVVVQSSDAEYHCLTIVLFWKSR